MISGVPDFVLFDFQVDFLCNCYFSKLHEIGGILHYSACWGLATFCNNFNICFYTNMN